MDCMLNGPLTLASDIATFAEIFEYMEPVSNACDADFTLVYSPSATLECLKLKSGMGLVAAFFETVRC